MNDDQLLFESVSKLFQAQVDPLKWRRSEEQLLPSALIAALEEAGFLSLLASEQHGGSGGSLTYAAILLKAAARAGARGPIAETLLGRGLLSAYGTRPPSGLITFGVGVQSCRSGHHPLTECCPWGRNADHLLIASGRGLEAMPLRPVLLKEKSVNIAGEPRDVIGHPRDGVEAPSPLLLAGALARSCQMAGAAELVLELTVEYAQTRVQFGRPIGQFQAIQHQLAILATETAAASEAVRAAAIALDKRGLREISSAAFEIAVAKARTGEAAGRIAAIAHQVHGAIGFTEEHRLHRATRALWSWRAECGHETFWQQELGRAALRRGADHLWADITAR